MLKQITQNFFKKQYSTPQPILNMKEKYACRNVKMMQKKQIRKSTLKMIEKENCFFFFTKKMCF